MAIVAISASEKQRDGSYLADYKFFLDRLNKLGLDQLPRCVPLCYFDITFWDECVFSSNPDTDKEHAIHNIPFPNIAFNYEIFLSETKNKGRTGSQTKKWKNAKCDVLAIWSHIHADRDIFVTSDANFHKQTHKSRLLALGASGIEKPEAALALL